MAIDWDPATRAFELRNDGLTYILRVHRNGALGGVYLGSPLARGGDRALLLGDAFDGFDNRLAASVALEYPTAGSGDYRVRETAAKTLFELGPYAYPAVLRTTRVKETEVAARAKDLVDARYRDPLDVPTCATPSAASR